MVAAPHVVSAPGKLMIAGEYAVLEGAEAVVAAVSRRAYAELGGNGEASHSPEVIATRSAAERRAGGPVSGAISIDAGELQDNGRKLGLGSSAAKAAATAGLVFAAHGQDVQAPAVREQILLAALEGHRAVAPHGSGADVAAAVLGGYVRFRRLGEGVETHALPWPKGLQTVVVWTGNVQGTAEMVAGVRALASRDPALYRTHMRMLAEQSDQLVSALIAGDLPSVIDCTHGYGTAMGELGQAAGIHVLTPAYDSIRALARESGGAAKPSGAGGGDVALALFSSTQHAETFRASCAGQGFEVLSLELGVPGERNEEQ